MVSHAFNLDFPNDYHNVEHFFQVLACHHLVFLSFFFFFS